MIEFFFKFLSQYLVKSIKNDTGINLNHSELRFYTKIMECSSSGVKRSNHSVSNDNSKRAKIMNNNREKTRAGFITRIVLKNFMCHSMLEINFTSNTSIIVGDNGSGKSAILTALVVGLGGKANVTNRGNNMKGFVKVGQKSGSVEITLCNDGAMAHKPKIYGPSITIIRKFAASGSSMYKILNHSGEIVTNKFKEVKNITSKLNIQIDNPICVLNQDTSRNFLSSNNPKHKFTLFMKATRLEALANEYEQTLKNKIDSMGSLNDEKKNFDRMQKKLQKLEQKITIHESMSNLKDEESQLQVELLWSKVRDIEVEIEKEEKVLEKLTKECNDFYENSSKRTKKIEWLKSNIRSDEQKLTELKNTIELQSRPCIDIKKTLVELNTVYETKEREKKALQTNIKMKNDDIKNLKHELENIEQKKNDIEQLKAERAKLSSDLEQKLKANDDILKTARNDLFQIRADLERKLKNETSFETEIREFDQNINKYQERMNSIKNERGNTLSLYGRNVPKVKQLIEQYKNKFQKVPRGPLGSYIKLKDKKWAVAAEGHISPGLLSAFVVDNNRDNRLLVQILQKAGIERMPIIITTKFLNKVHDVSNNLVKSPSDCTSLFDILEIEDPIVNNCIIDEAGIEGILLVPSDERAMTIFSYRENVPRNCKQGITIKGDRYFPDPNYRTYCSEYHHAQYLQTDASERIKQLEGKISELKQQKQAVMNQNEQIKQERNLMLNKKQELKMKIERLMKNTYELRRQLDNLRNTDEPAITDADVLRQELAHMKKVLVDKTIALEKIENEMGEIEKAIEKTREKLSQMTEGVKKLENRLPELQDRIREDQSRIRELTMNDNSDNKTKADLEKRLKEQTEILEYKQTHMVNLRKDARNVGERPEQLREVRVIVEKLDIIGRQLKKSQSSNETIEELIEKFNDLTEKVTSAQNILEKLGESLHQLDLAEKNRRKLYKATEYYVISYMKQSFAKILETRHFQGSINIDIEKKILDLVVIPQQGNQGRTSTSNLSGGERSFSTVAFLYSLWQCVDFPFYFLDEFDVYMDKLNRAKVFDILLHHAKSKPEFQYVFLTPQDLSFRNENATILRLDDPRKNNA